MTSGRRRGGSGRAFAEVVFDGWTPAQLAAVPAARAELSPTPTAAEMALPLGAAALFIELRARMHGLVTLELVGHLHPFNDHGAAFFDAAINRMSAEVDAVQRADGMTLGHRVVGEPAQRALVQRHRLGADRRAGIDGAGRLRRVGQALLLGEQRSVRASTRPASSSASTSSTLRTSSVVTGSGIR